MTFYINAVKATSPETFNFTDHNRAPITFAYESIEDVIRTADGTTRKFVVATKRSFDLSWEMLPTSSTYIEDELGGAGAIRDFYNNNYGKKITLELVHHGSSTSTLDRATTKETMSVFITSFSYNVVKRLSTYDYVNVSIGFAEV